MNWSQLAQIESLGKLFLILFSLLLFELFFSLVAGSGQPVEEAISGENYHIEEEEIRPVGGEGDHLGELVRQCRDTQETEEPEDTEVGAH